MSDHTSRGPVPDRSTPVDDARFRRIGGIDQFVYVTGDRADNPLVVHLHGGPGLPFSNKAWLLADWKPFFTTVFWDQRGAGKTALRNPAAAPTIDTMLSDLHELVEAVKAEFGQDRVCILGHSWGTVIGSLYALRHPENVACYVGVGQVVDAMGDEAAGFAELRRRVDAAGNAEHAAQLAALEPYPGDAADILPKMLAVRGLQNAYGIASFDPELDAERQRRSPLWRDDDARAREVSVALLGELFRELGEFDLRAAGTLYRVPVAYLLGADDWQVPRVRGEEYFADIEAPEKHLRIIAGARHVPMLEQPAAFLDALRAVVPRAAE